MIARSVRTASVSSGQRYGSWEVLSSAPFTKCAALYVTSRCLSCGTVKDVSLRMMEVGRTTMCKACSTRQRHGRQGRLIVDTQAKQQLQRRAAAMRQRCTNPKDRAYKNYGGRGVEFRFPSVRACVEYVLEHLPLEDYSGVDIDRSNNDGHYEPGNLRLATRAENLRNRRKSVVSATDAAWAASRACPYSTLTGLRYLRMGLTRQEIIDRARKAVAEKRKSWALIEVRLRYMTSSTPDLDTASL